MGALADADFDVAQTRCVSHEFAISTLHDVESLSVVSGCTADEFRALWYGFLVALPTSAGANSGFDKATLTGYFERLGSENVASGVVVSSRRHKVCSKY